MSEPFGPFREGLDIKERTAQLRCLRTLVHLFFPLPELELALRQGESGESRESAKSALAMFDAIPSLPRRKILTTFVYLNAPSYTKGRKGVTRNPPDDDRQDDRTGREIGQTQASSPRP